jgi:hypothetical protein
MDVSVHHIEVRLHKSMQKTNQIGLSGSLDTTWATKQMQNMILAHFHPS